MEIAQRYAQTVAGAALGESPFRTRVRVTGPTHLRFLQGLFSGDVQTLAPGQGCEGFFPTVQGKILAHGFLLRGDDAVDFVGWGDQREALLAHLQKYAIVEDVELEDLSAEGTERLLVGPQGVELLQRIISTSLPAADRDHQTVAWAGTTLRVWKAPVFTLPAYALWGPSEAIQSLVAQLDREDFVAEGSADLWETLRIENRFPVHGIDITAEHLGQEANRTEQAINFRKGCYLGQETIARIDAMGHVNRRLVPVTLTTETIPPLPAEIENAEGKSVGRVTSACWSPRDNKTIGLAMIRRGSDQPGTSLVTSWGTVTVG